MLRVAGIVRESIVDGDGIRYVIFTQGCKHKCEGCHNPETWNFNGGNEANKEEIIDDMLKNPLLDGITFSGGDPLFQASELVDIAIAAKEHGLNIWLYTGFHFEDFILFKNNCCTNELVTSDMLNLLKYVDVVVDGPFVKALRSLDCLFRGSTNQRLIDCKKSLEENRIVQIE